MTRSLAFAAAGLVALGGTAGSAIAQQPQSPTSVAEGTGATLPPVVVVAPKERISAPAKVSKPAPEPEPAPQSSKAAKKPAAPSAGDAPAQGGGTGGGEPADGTGGGVAGPGVAGARNASSGLNGVFALGELDMVGGAVVSSEAMRTFSKDTLDASLALAPGVVASNSGGSRNEQLIYVRGFDRWQVPISIDGIRVYRPADNRFDFSAFLTPDMSEVQIAKGYTSVLNGPGGMGGAINLVTKKPQQAIEGEVQGGITLGPKGQYEGYKTYASVGTRQQGYYAQASGLVIDYDGWGLSGAFVPGAIENGGERDHSYKNTWQVNAKIGLTPNSTDDYSINYIRSEISRGAPYHIEDRSSTVRYWDWPGTKTENLYMLSHTKLGSASFVDTKLYYSRYADDLEGYDDPAQTSQKLAAGRVFASYYHDWSLGGSVTAGTDITSWDTLKGAIHYRRDVHDEWQRYNITGRTCATPPCVDEPKQQDKEDTYSVALENTVHLNRQLDWVAGVSYDWRFLYKAEEYTDATATAKGFMFEYNKKDTNALNWQSALVYRLTASDTLHISYSDRTRFPTIFERFSSRFGGATSNPDLQPERAKNYEIGWASNFASGSRFATAVFYSDVKDLIQSVNINYNGTIVGQSQNVGNGEFFGIEASVDVAVSNTLVVGGNATLMHRDVTNPPRSHVELTGVPDFKGIAYLSYRVTDALSLTPSVEFATTRWTANTFNTISYYRTGAFALLNMQAEYNFTPKTSLLLSARNLLDENYQLTDGYPEAGRSFQATMRAKF